MLADAAKEALVMQTENRLFDDLARVATGALGALTGMREEIEARMREQFERILDRMNLVRREEFDAVQAMAQKARVAQEALEQRVAALEARLMAQAPSATAEGAPLRSRPATKRAKAPPESE
jgi:BMFP domain-containing protein YqiC